jgi:serine/threonine protein kinase
MHLEAGSFLRDYEIEKLLGQGGMGTVYLARDSFLDRYVAIKELSPLLTADAGLVERFRNEARMQAKLNHAGIVSLHSFFEQNGRYYMVMEYAPGRSLKDIIRQTGPIPEKRAINILQQAISAMEYAHGVGIVHRDIKPSNIVLDNNDRVKVLDFGIARIMGERGLTQTGQQLGTVAYMSPEQVKAEKDIDGKTDVYSLGVTFFEMLSGHMPYDMNTESDYMVMTKIVNNPLPDPRNYYPHISDKTMQLLARMTEKDRHRRAGIAELKSDDGDGNGGDDKRIFLGIIEGAGRGAIMENTMRHSFNRVSVGPAARKEKKKDSILKWFIVPLPIMLYRWFSKKE